MQDYDDVGITKFGIDKNSLGAQPRNRTMAMRTDTRLERTPYLNPVSVSRGSVVSTLGGITTFKDKTGGTVIFTYDPETGTITMNGGILVNQTLNLGTIYNTQLTGSTSNTGNLYLGNVFAGTLNGVLFDSGTITNSIVRGTIGTATMIGGTLSNAIVSNSFIAGGSFVSPSLIPFSGSSALGTSGMFAIQTYGGSAIWVVRSGTVTYRFTPSGVL